MKLLSIFRSYIPIRVPDVDTVARDKEIKVEVVKEKSSGNISLSTGHYKTKKDLDAEFEKYREYDFVN